MILYPAAPEWKDVCSPPPGAADEDARRIAVLTAWLDRCQLAELEQGAEEISDDEFAVVVTEQAPVLRPDEQVALLKIFRQKSEKKPRERKARNENGWEPLAALLRSNPSRRLVLVAADLVEFGAFAITADLAPNIKIRAIDAAKQRAWIIERLRAAYAGVSDQLLLERASDLTVAFTDFRETDRIQDLNIDAADKWRLRLPALIRAIRRNMW